MSHDKLERLIFKILTAIIGWSFGKNIVIIIIVQNCDDNDGDELIFTSVVNFVVYDRMS